MRCFFIKRRPLEKTAPAAGSVQKDTSRVIASSIEGPGAEPPEKFGGYDMKVLAFPFHFPVDKFAAQLTSLLRPEQLRRLYNIQKTAIHEARPYLEAQRSSKTDALCR